MFGLPKFGDGIGLSRIMRFFAAHGVDEMQLAERALVVTGSNGKGSTSRLLAAALGANGRRIGLFTSPHLFNVRERFVVGEERIGRAAFDRLAKTVLAFNDALPTGNQMGAFEFLFCLAVLWFAEEQADLVVWEAGIGGRYDPVRSLRAKLSVLTGLELEHTQILGATEELIAYDKIDALAAGGALIVSPSVDARHYERIAAYCSLTNRQPIFVAKEVSIANIANRPDGVGFDFKVGGAPGEAAHLSLIGRHQVDNALTALRTACHRDSRPFDAASRARFLPAIAAARWPGRLEKAASNPDLWIDVGHTPRALDLVTDAALEFLDPKKTLIVFGVSASKEVAEIAAIVASKFEHFILTRAHKAGAGVERFADVFADKDRVIEPDIAAAARLAKSRAAKDGLSVLALGGMFLAVEVQHAWSGGDPKELDFF